jgi:hypothetical protein
VSNCEHEPNDSERRKHYFVSVAQLANILWSEDICIFRNALASSGDDLLYQHFIGVPQQGFDQTKQFVRGRQVARIM